MILVSACLAGINCNYKGESKPNKKIIELIKKGKAIPICPEQLGGLATPRSGARILSNKGLDIIENRSRLITDDSQDVTDQYLRGAQEILKIIDDFNVLTVILKQGSPSCGNGKTQGGEERRELVQEDGVTVALLKKNGVQVYSEDDLEIEDIWKNLSGE